MGVRISVRGGGVMGAAMWQVDVSASFRNRALCGSFARSRVLEVCAVWWADAPRNSRCVASSARGMLEERPLCGSLAKQSFLGEGCCATG